jgi:putative resolvase
MAFCCGVCDVARRSVGKVVAQVGSGLNVKRPNLARLLSDPSATVIVVKRKDRLAHFGIGHLNRIQAAQGRRIVGVDDRETTDDLMRDMIRVLASIVHACTVGRGARIGRCVR